MNLPVAIQRSPLFPSPQLWRRACGSVAMPRPELPTDPRTSIISGIPPPAALCGRPMAHEWVAPTASWLCVAAIHTSAALGLVYFLRGTFFGRVDDDCTGPILAECADDPNWRWALNNHEPCASFAPAPASAGSNETLHMFCDGAKDVAKVPATKACRTSCSTCSWGEFFEVFVAGAPIWARNAFLVALLAAGCSRLSGFERRTGLMQKLLLGPTQAAADTVSLKKSGWAAIAGVQAGDPPAEPQATWPEACEARALTQKQAVASAATKLVLWHWSQPIAYLLVLWGYRCYVAALGPQQRTLAAVVASREVVYLLTTVLATACCPVFLLLDPSAAWKEAPTKLDKCVRVAMYVLTPHNYTA
eukprot:68555_4